MLELNGELKANYGFLFCDDDLADLNKVLKDEGFEETDYDEIARLWCESTRTIYDIKSKEYRIITYLEWNYACDCQLEHHNDYERTSSSF